MGSGMSRILPELYLGSIHDAKDTNQLNRNKVSHILSIYDDAKPLNDKQIFCCLSARDHSDQDLLQFMPRAIEFIHEARLANNGAVLVHCMAGISRSATLIMAYMMVLTGLSPDILLRVMRSARRIVNPNRGFWKQLKHFHKNLHGLQREFRTKFPIEVSLQWYDDFARVEQLYASSAITCADTNNNNNNDATCKASEASKPKDCSVGNIGGARGGYVLEDVILIGPHEIPGKLLIKILSCIPTFELLKTTRLVSRSFASAVRLAITSFDIVELTRCSSPTAISARFPLESYSPTNNFALESKVFSSLLPVVGGNLKHFSWVHEDHTSMSRGKTCCALAANPRGSAVHGSPSVDPRETTSLLSGNVSCCCDQKLASKSPAKPPVAPLPVWIAEWIRRYCPSLQTLTLDGTVDGFWSAFSSGSDLSSLHSIELAQGSFPATAVSYFNSLRSLIAPLNIGDSGGNFSEANRSTTGTSASTGTSYIDLHRISILDHISSLEGLSNRMLKRLEDYDWKESPKFPGLKSYEIVGLRSSSSACDNSYTRCQELFTCVMDKLPRLTSLAISESSLKDVTPLATLSGTLESLDLRKIKLIIDPNFSPVTTNGNYKISVLAPLASLSLLSSLSINGLTTVELDESQIESAELSPHDYAFLSSLSRLQLLSVDSAEGFGPDALSYASMGAGPTLTHLSLRHCRAVSRRGIETLISLPIFPRLHSLHIGNPSSRQGQQQQIQSTQIEDILAKYNAETMQNEATTDSNAAAVNAAVNGGLRCLRLTDNAVNGDALLRFLTSTAGGTKLCHLSVRNCGVTQDAIVLFLTRRASCAHTVDMLRLEIDNSIWEGTDELMKSAKVILKH